MNEHGQARAARAAVVFLLVHCTVAVMLMLLAPGHFEDVPSPIAEWGQLVETIFPNVLGLSGFVKFQSEAWVTLVLMWTLFPLSIWWVARGDWVFFPNQTLLRRRPWLLALLAVFLLTLTALLAVHAPTPSTGGFRYHDRVNNAIARSPQAFGIFVGIIFSGMAMFLGVLPKLLRVAREVTSDDAL